MLKCNGSNRSNHSFWPKHLQPSRLQGPACEELLRSCVLPDRLLLDFVNLLLCYGGIKAVLTSNLPQGVAVVGSRNIPWKSNTIAGESAQVISELMEPNRMLRHIVSRCFQRGLLIWTSPFEARRCKKRFRHASLVCARQGILTATHAIKNQQASFAGVPKSIQRGICSKGRVRLSL